jgi:hypothetical protein
MEQALVFVAATFEPFAFAFRVLQVRPTRVLQVLPTRS